MSVLLSPTLPRRLLLGGVLVLVAIAGAGLAAAADKPHTDTDRPELTARADRAFAPWRERLRTELAAAADDLGQLSLAGREVVGSLYQQRLDSVEDGLGRGAAAAASVAAHRQALVDIRLEQTQSIGSARLGERNRSFVAAVDEAIQRLASITDSWTPLEAVARSVVDLVRAIDDHDSAVAAATAAGRNSNWSDALGRLRAAATSLALAEASRNVLAANADVASLDDLLARYAAYDAALTRLYEALDGGAAPGSLEVIALAEDVESAAAGLPEDRSAITVAIADATGSVPVQALVVIEEARGLVDETIALAP